MYRESWKLIISRKKWFGLLMDGMFLVVVLLIGQLDRSRRHEPLPLGCSGRARVCARRCMSWHE